MANVTVSPEALAAMIAQAVAAAMAQAGAERKETAIKAAKDGKSERSMKNEIAAVKAFKKAGFKGDIVPHKTIMTYNRWMAEGRKVRVGEHAIKVKNLRLFHISQTDVITAEEKADAVASMQAAIATHNEKRKALKVGTPDNGEAIPA